MTTDLARRDIGTIRADLAAATSRIREVLPRHIPAERIIRLALLAVNRTPKLLDCTRESFLLSVLVAARLGLGPDGALGEGYLIPYGNQATFLPGYRGLVSLAIRSGKVRSVVSRVVHERDRFRVVLGTEDSIRHTPSDEEDPGAWTHVYAVATLVDGGKQFEVMSRKQIMALKARSRASGSGPWQTDEEEMARKSCIRRLAKSLPLSAEFAGALALQAGAEGGEADMQAVADSLGVVEPGTVYVKATVETPAGAAPPPSLPSPPAGDLRAELAQKRARAKAEKAAKAAANPQASPPPGAAASPVAASPTTVPTSPAATGGVSFTAQERLRDLVARLGGDQFEDLACVLLEGNPEDRDRGIAESVRKATLAHGIAEADFVREAKRVGVGEGEIPTVAQCLALSLLLPLPEGAAK
jgi:recombination protein RecT